MKAKNTSQAGERTHIQAAQFFNAQQDADPEVCLLDTDRLSDGSVVWNVIFHEEVVFCLDREAAEKLVKTINKAVKEAQ